MMYNRMYQGKKGGAGMIKHLPNFITFLRMVGTFVLLFVTPLTDSFYVIYTLTGVTDVLDGTLARKLKLTSKLGAKLDSIADILFYTLVILRLFPEIIPRLPKEIWYIVGAVVLIRLVSYAVAAVKFRCFASLHTYMNKLTGAAVFFIPYVIKLSFFTEVCFVICAIAAIAALDELRIHLTRKPDKAEI